MGQLPWNSRELIWTSEYVVHLFIRRASSSMYFFVSDKETVGPVVECRVDEGDIETQYDSCLTLLRLNEGILGHTPVPVGTKGFRVVAGEF